MMFSFQVSIEIPLHLKINIKPAKYLNLVLLKSSLITKGMGGKG